MKKKIHHYDGDNARVDYDVARCIHVAECVRRLPAAFNPQRRPWIQPDGASMEDLSQAIAHCPTGALHLHREGEPEEPVGQNLVTVSPDGPLYLQGDIEVVSEDEQVLLRDTRIALCRCGASANKPLCDGKHKDAEFQESGYIETAGEQDVGEAEGTLRVTVAKNGPVVLSGPFQLRSGSGDKTVTQERAALCRCGQSSNRPFCDGSHVVSGFEAD